MPNDAEFLSQPPVVGSEEDLRQYSPREEEVARVVTGALAGGTAVLEDVLVKESGSARSLIILVDGAEEPLDIDALAEASQKISEALDVTDPMGAEPYDLEVSTPGVSRPLTHLRHFTRNVGRLLKIKRRGDESSPETLEGRLLEADENGILIQATLPAKKGVKPKLAEPERIAFADIIKAKAEVDFSAVDAQTEVEEA